MTNLNTAARAYALSLDAQCPPSPTESFEAGWESAQGEIERLQKREDQLMEFLRSFISGGINQDFKPWARELYQKLYRTTDEPEVGATFPSVIKAQADTIGVLARRVVRMGSPLRDHACPQCVPEGGDLVNYGFVCAYHLASYLVTCPEYQLPDASRDASSETDK